MDIDDYDFLIEIIKLHKSPRGYKGKGTALMPLDQHQMLIASEQIFYLFPQKNPATGRERRQLVEQRLDEILTPGYDLEKFKLFCDMIESVYSHYLKANRKMIKYGIGSVRDHHSTIYNEIIAEQNYRCLFCGYQFIEGENDIELDHILPFKIGGDQYNGSNWQFTCKDCNYGKRDLFSYLQHRVAYGWVYHLPGWVPETEGRSDKSRIRFIVLARDKKCRSCSAGPRDVRLDVVNNTHGLSISKNMICLCDNCR